MRKIKKKEYDRRKSQSESAEYGVLFTRDKFGNMRVRNTAKTIRRSKAWMDHMNKMTERRCRIHMSTAPLGRRSWDDTSYTGDSRWW